MGEYKRPGFISNANLVDPLFADRITLRRDLIEHHDFEAIPPAVWAYLVNWYGFADKSAILRPIAFDTRCNSFYVDLYLE